MEDQKESSSAKLIPQSQWLNIKVPAGNPAFLGVLLNWPSWVLKTQKVEVIWGLSAGGALALCPTSRGGR